MRGALSVLRRYGILLPVILFATNAQAGDEAGQSQEPPQAPAQESPPPYVVPPKEPAAPLQVAGPSEAPAAKPSKPHERSTVEFASLAAGAFYVRGEKLVGVGTLTRYHVLVGIIQLDVTRFPTDRLGFELHFHGGPVGFNERSDVDISLGGAGLVAPFKWKGKAPGSFVLGIGAALEAGRPVWLDPGVHGAPYALARFRIFPNDEIGLQTTYRFVPVTTESLTTDSLLVQEHDIDVGVSKGLLLLGARMRIDEATGGQPTRLYRSYGFGLFVGFAVY